jgi:hypothetical protein
MVVMIFPFFVIFTFSTLEIKAQQRAAQSAMSEKAKKIRRAEMLKKQMKN